MRRKLFIALITGSLLTAASPALATQWVQFRFDGGQSGVNPDEATITVSNADAWRVGWELYPSARRYTTAPIVTEDQIIVGGSKLLGDGSAKAAVWSFDVATGAVNWVRPLTCARVRPSSMALGQGTIIASLIGCAPAFPAGDRVAFIDATTGAHLRTRQLNGNVGPPTIEGGTAVVNNAGEIAVIDIATRSITDIFFINEAFQASGTREPWPLIDGTVYTNDSGRGGPAVAGDVLVTNTNEVRLYSLADGGLVDRFVCTEEDERLACAIDMATGDVLWSRQEAEWLSNVLVVDDVAYHVCGFPSGTGLPLRSLCAFDLDTGSPIWNGDDTGLIALGETHGWRPIFAGGVVFLGGFDLDSGEPAVMGFDPASGDVVTNQLDGTPWGDFFIPGGKFLAVANGLLVTTVPAVRVMSFD
jgi:outer membrane protein assembly factor BamB